MDNRQIVVSITAMLVMSAISVFLGFNFSNSRVLEKPAYHNLEIHTPSPNTYYIDGLSVTNEVYEELILFESQEALNRFVSDITAKEVRENLANRNMREEQEVILRLEKVKLRREESLKDMETSYGSNKEFYHEDIGRFDMEIETLQWVLKQ